MPSSAGSWVVNFWSFSFSIAALGRMLPDSEATPMRKVPWKGDLRTMTPLYLSFTSTWSRVGKRALQSDFSMRSKEYLTSSAVSSPASLLHICPGLRVKEMWVGSSWVHFSTYSDGSQPQGL